ncbi:MAG TPA: CDP-alcohol phosphatidyltransferase family protein [Bacteroidetes bacterium]|nr:CDP-alcohol phosphatidyltransferase family protein [Bacteroidota bacterium]
MADQHTKEVLKTISKGRKRTNILKKYEQRAIAFLVQIIPNWISSDMLTFIGFLGNFIVFLSFILAFYIDKWYLLLGVAGFFISWFGDSLDGRVAYYRNKPRKWYGFVLDLTVDWISTIFIGLGFIVYTNNQFSLLGYAFVVLYGWEMITTLLRYKITGKYAIDSGLFGPTEVRILISLLLILEIVIPGSIIYLAGLMIIGLFIFNISDFLKLLKMADNKDIEEKKKK